MTVFEFSLDRLKETKDSVAQLRYSEKTDKYLEPDPQSQRLLADLFSDNQRITESDILDLA